MTIAAMIGKIIVKSLLFDATDMGTAVGGLACVVVGAGVAILYDPADGFVVGLGI